MVRDPWPGCARSGSIGAMDHATVVTLISLATPALAAGGIYLFARLSIATTRYVHNATLLAALAAIEKYAEASVAFVYQTLVKTAKDPNAPGVWNAEIAADAKTAAIARVRQIGPLVIVALRAAGADPDATISQFVEKAVAALNAAVAANAKVILADTTSTPTAPQRKMMP